MNYRKQNRQGIYEPGNGIILQAVAAILKVKKDENSN